MSAKNQWRVIDAQGGMVWAPAIIDVCGNSTCTYGGDVWEREDLAVMAWALGRGHSVAELVAPGAMSADERVAAMKERCLKAVDELYGRLELASTGDGGEFTSYAGRGEYGDRNFLDDEECADALDGVRLAMSAIDTLDETEET